MIQKKLERKENPLKKEFSKHLNSQKDPKGYLRQLKVIASEQTVKHQRYKVNKRMYKGKEITVEEAIKLTDKGEHVDFVREQPYFVELKGTLTPIQYFERVKYPNRFDENGFRKSTQKVSKRSKKDKPEANPILPIEVEEVEE